MAKTTLSPLAPASFPDLPVIGGVTFASVAAGVRYQGRQDVMLAVCAPGTAMAGVFTRSATRSAPVLDCQEKLARGGDEGAGAAIIVNSGNSNAFTGARGSASVGRVTGAVAERLQIPSNRVYSASTGVIGEPLPDERITAKIAGIAKGSGMIAPDMATMLVYIFTDAKIEAGELQDLVAHAADRTFNCITVDSDTSTSDSLMVAATGASGADVSGSGTFAAALEAVMLDLAHQVVRDGEGATKFVTVAVTGAVDHGDARKVAMAIANSPLVKTAIAGEDPNWGRIVMAVGKSGAVADRDLLSIRFGDILVAEKGWVSPDYAEAKGAAVMKQQDIDINVDLGLGAGAATVWTCDLTHGYISINADYRS